MALQRAEKGKAMGPGGIPVEVCKCMGEEGLAILWDLLQKIYEQEKMPGSGATVSLYRYSKINETSRGEAITGALS